MRRTPVGPNYHKLALAHLKGLCAEFKVSRPRLYTKRWKKEWGDNMGIYTHSPPGIYINLKVHTYIDEIYDTVAHELGHHVTRRLPAADHGPEWKEAARKFGAKAHSKG